MASNQNVNKVVYGGTTLIDLTDDTAVASDVISGKTFHLKSGAKATGTAVMGDGVLTIQKNGTDVATFSANQTGNVTANIAVPTKTSELTNNSGFLTSHQDISGKVDKINITPQNTQALYPIKINAQGQIVAYGSAVTIPTVPSAMNQSEASAGTSTTVRTITAKVLSDTILEKGGIPELPITGTCSPTATSGSIEQSNFRYALSADRTIGMIWGDALIRGSGTQTGPSAITMDLGVTVAQQDEPRQIRGLIGGSLPGNTVDLYTNLYVQISTAGEVSLHYKATTNLNYITLPPVLVRFSDVDL